MDEENAEEYNRYFIDVVYYVLHKYYYPAQVAWTSFHNNVSLVRKYLHTYHIGHLIDGQREVSI